MGFTVSVGAAGAGGGIGDASIPVGRGTGRGRIKSFGWAVGRGHEAPRRMHLLGPILGGEGGLNTET